MKLSNEIALITGGTSGLGLDAARLFAAEGAQVVIMGADLARLDAASRELGSEGLALRADLRTPSDWKKSFTGLNRGSAASTFSSPMLVSVLPHRWKP
jgi:NAD(P)-dependent dehydrogenase (short-subunit alcohol dehydrogenase family)